jgi:hypothetical protein
MELTLGLGRKVGGIVRQVAQPCGLDIETDFATAPRPARLRQSRATRPLFHGQSTWWSIRPTCRPWLMRALQLDARELTTAPRERRRARGRRSCVRWRADVFAISTSCNARGNGPASAVVVERDLARESSVSIEPDTRGRERRPFSRRDRRCRVNIVRSNSRSTRPSTACPGSSAPVAPADIFILGLFREPPGRGSRARRPTRASRRADVDDGWVLDRAHPRSQTSRRQPASGSDPRRRRVPVCSSGLQEPRFGDRTLSSHDALPAAEPDGDRDLVSR